MSIEKLDTHLFQSTEEFIEACYQIYKNTWLNNPKFNSKPIFRDTTLQKAKEVSFWGIVEGHDEGVIFEYLERYVAIPFFEYIMSNANSSNNGETDDIIWYTVQRRINIISKEYNYLIVLSERQNKCFFVTAYPISENKKNSKIKAWRQEQRYKKTEAAKK